MRNDENGETSPPAAEQTTKKVPVISHLRMESAGPVGLQRDAHGAIVPDLSQTTTQASPSQVALGADSAPADGGAGLPSHSAQVMVPVEPPLGVLVSMAVCLDHGFGLLSSERQKSQLYDMRKLYDEVVGHGYYHPEREGYYLGFVGVGVKDESSSQGEDGWTPTYD